MEPVDAKTDLVLLDKVKQGDTRSFEALFERYWEPLYVTACNRLKDAEEAKEVVQDLFVSLWRRRTRLSIDTSLRAYLFSALKYAILDHMRAQIVREKYVKMIQRKTTVQRNATEEAVTYHELQRKVQEGIATLPTRCQQVFHLRRLEHLSVKEIAEKMSISPKTVENQLTKATKVLRMHLKEYVTIALFFLSTLLY